MYKHARTYGLLVLFSLVISSTTNAGLVSATSSIGGLNLGWNQSESNSLQTFDELQNVAIKHNHVYVDYLVGSNLTIGQAFTGLNHSNSGLLLNKGTYSSHLLHFDPVGTKSGKAKQLRVEFDSDIVAIILGGEYLKLSDGLLGHSNTHYDASISRRMETHDLFTLESSKTLLVNEISVGRYWTDNARVLTQSVPEPSAWALFGLGLLGLVCARKIAKN